MPPAPFRRFALAFALALTAIEVVATENGASHRGLGNDTVLIGLMGPPGSTFLGGTLVHYAGNVTEPAPGLSNFTVEATAMTVRMSYVWPQGKLFGADIETRLGFAGYAQAKPEFDAGPVHVTQSYSDTFPGATVAPVLLGWHSKTLHQIAGVQFFVPTRNYRGGGALNVSTGFAAASPVYFLTWFPDEKVEVDAAAFYMFNGKNRETNYRSGQEFSVDYAAGYNVNPVAQVGINGYVYRQTTDDTLDGNVVRDGNRGGAFSIGPFVRLRPAQNWGIVFKWQIETWTDNRPRGNRFFLQMGVLL